LELVELSQLEEGFYTKVNRKIKAHYHLEAPEYEPTLTIKSNEMTQEQLVEVFKAVDIIMAERKLLDAKRKYQLAPTIDLVYGETVLDIDAFREMITRIRPVYEMAVTAKTEEESHVCKDCLCFSCEEKSRHEDCSCPCSGYPNHPAKQWNAFITSNKSLPPTDSLLCLLQNGL
jgi:hypothetical protein